MRRLLWVGASGKIVAGGLLVLVGLGFLVASVSDWRDRRAYATAEVCGAGRADGCVVAQSARVEHRRMSSHRSDEYYLTLRLADGTSTTVELPKPEPVYDAADPGGLVGVRFWRGRVARVVTVVGAAETEHSPLVASVHGTLYGGMMVVWGGLFAWLGLDQRRGRGTVRAPGVRGADRHAKVGRTIVAAAIATIVPFFQVTAFDVVAPLPVALAFVVTLVPLWWAFARRA